MKIWKYKEDNEGEKIWMNGRECKKKVKIPELEEKITNADMERMKLHR